VARDVFPPVWLKERCAMCWQRGLAACQRVRGAASPIGSRGLRTIKDASKKTFGRLHATQWQVLASRDWKLLVGIGAVILLIVI
jgi:hypothetical protein